MDDKSPDEYRWSLTNWQVGLQSGTRIKIFGYNYIVWYWSTHETILLSNFCLSFETRII